ncbi:hypothetical protein ANN_26346 [Periplaneta americana]|uniref:Uncharacterized protein n=1 Tax=Periplaneta americana TaxID=6978 RepID=A0ABQ8S5P3_PERAM|nr:hypothetical protein ANN_26346 [Periplaneta americana]
MNFVKVLVAKIGKVKVKKRSKKIFPYINSQFDDVSCHYDIVLSRTIAAKISQKVSRRTYDKNISEAELQHVNQNVFRRCNACHTANGEQFHIVFEKVPKPALQSLRTSVASVNGKSNTDLRNSTPCDASTAEALAYGIEEAMSTC